MAADRERVLVTRRVDCFNNSSVESAPRIREACGLDPKPTLDLTTRSRGFVVHSEIPFVRQERMRSAMRADRHSVVTHLGEHFPAQRAKGPAPRVFQLDVHL